MMPSSPPLRLSAEAIAQLQQHPDFTDAIVAAARGSLELHRAGRLMNWILSDRARALLPFLLLYLDATTQPGDPRSGVTTSRMKAFCVETELCSEGRATAMLALMRLSGFLEPVPGKDDKRVHRSRPTHKLLESVRARLTRQFNAMALVIPQMRDAAHRIGDPHFERALWRLLGEQFLSGVRIMDYAPDLAFFAERSAGMVILFRLLLSGEAGDTLPPSRPLPISIAALAREFKVSRTHVLRLLRDAEAADILERRGQEESLVLRPKLTAAALDMFAAMFLFMWDPVRQALDEVKHGGT